MRACYRELFNNFLPSAQNSIFSDCGMGEVEIVGERKFAGKFTEKSLLFIFAPTPRRERERRRREG